MMMTRRWMVAGSRTKRRAERHLLIRYLENSEISSEYSQIAARWCEAGRAASMTWGEIPCAAEQGN
jgi:hypothetical protein